MGAQPQLAFFHGIRWRQSIPGRFHRLLPPGDNSEKDRHEARDGIQIELNDAIAGFTSKADPWFHTES